MDAFTAASTLKRRSIDADPLNSPAKIIIKKENIGLHEYQHQTYQYNLFNNNDKRDQYYEDLSKVKDRLAKIPPNMQQVVHRDMKRANTNKIYERKLKRDLTGPRGLNWQYRQKLQRLETSEREAARDLMRLRRELGRVSISSLSNQQFLPRQKTDLFRSPRRRFSGSTDSNSATEKSVRAKFLFGRPLSINTSRTTIDHFAPTHSKKLSSSKVKSSKEKLPWPSESTPTKMIETRSHLQIHSQAMNQQKREIERKLKKFLH